MATKKSKTTGRARKVQSQAPASSTSNPVKTAPLSAREFIRYIQEPYYALDGVAHLVAGDDDPHGPQMVGAYAMQQSSDKLYELMDALDKRFEDQHGQAPCHLFDGEEVLISHDELQEYEKALAPTFAFTSLARGAAFDREARSVNYIGYIGELITSVTREGIKELSERMKAGAA